MPLFLDDRSLPRSFVGSFVQRGRRNISGRIGTVGAGRMKDGAAKNIRRLGPGGLFDGDDDEEDEEGTTAPVKYIN